MKTRILAALSVSALVLAGCSGVPRSSAPRVIRPVPIGGAGTSAAATTPAPNIAPQVLISDFLAANVLDASSQTSPQAFLTATARRTWSDSSVTVVDNPVPGQFEPASGTVRVSARVLGTVDASGQYLASSNTQRQSLQYQVKLVNGQWRIDGLQDGLVLSENDFSLYFTQRPVYYYDLGRRYLVPDPRWTSLTDPDQLANWLMAGLASGPSDEIKNAVTIQSLPQQATARRISVQTGRITKIEIPGASQLPTAGLNELAAQVATTLTPAVQSGTMQITDGGRAVRIPDSGGTRFAAPRYADLSGPPQPPADVFFLRQGVMYGQDGSKVKGKVNDGRFFLQSVAVSRDRALRTLDIAATVNAGDDADARELLVGTQSGGLRRTAVRGPLTRPAFSPGRSEVWVGDGAKLYVVTVDNTTNTQRVTALALAGPVVDRIIALRLSPDGARIAIVVHSPGGLQQLYVGAVIRGPGQVRVDTLQQVSPQGVFVKDVAWAESLKLQAIGYNTSSFDNRIYDVGSDGSEFGSESIGNLPGAPTTLTVATSQPPWVTANKAVWQQQYSTQWASPTSSSRTSGYAAVYLE